MAQVVNVKVAYIRPKYNNLKEWMADPDNVYIARGGVLVIDGQRYPPKDSKFANPFKIGLDGNRATVIEKYKKYIQTRITKADLEALRGKKLGCWCAPEACHGDVLLELINAQ